MANLGQLWQLRQGAREWNSWRMRNGTVYPDLRNADLKGADLSSTNLSYADLRSANLNGAKLFQASLFKANLTGADLRGADLGESNLNEAILDGVHHTERSINKALLERTSLKGANLRGTTFIESSLAKADFTGANLTGARFDRAILDEANFTLAQLNRANFTGTSMLGTILHDADLSGSFIYGVSAWDLLINDGTKQQDLIVTPHGKPVVTVDNIKVAQFIHLLLDNKEIRDIIDTVTSKAVLILGRFSDERRPVLSALREELRRLGYLPMMFDFECPDSKDTTETVMILAGLSSFVIADITSPRSTPLELQATIPDCMTPFVPILQEDEEPFSMFVDLRHKNDWVLDVLKYDSSANLITKLETAVIGPALERRRQMTLRKAKGVTTRHIRDYP